ncbi:hypothetical protein [Spirosoma spitsbergense]|jgi:hypothetical protein|uniref:hypothetical protein n=1 Tax=Spirosoma spitsbergense TaxID=431554 RepID=UPI00035EC9E3|nr:hypothetical protein [Spirosoma spitsbergense]
MKTLIKSLALALSLAVVTSSATFAETNPGGKTKTVATYKTGMYMTQAGKLSIALDKEKGGTVSISLKSADGRILYNRHLSKNDQIYRTRLNLNQLEDGVYQVEITNGVETTTQSVTISTQQPATPNRLVSIR